MSCPVGTEKLDPLGICGVVIDDKVEVQSLVGEGAFGFVYRGVHRGFDAPVAIKCLKLAPHYDREAQDRLVAKLREEGRTMMRLSQRTSAIVQAHDIGAFTTPGGARVPYLVLEWLEGRALFDELAARSRAGSAAMTAGEALALLAPVAQALAIAHGNNIAHRDIKPENLFLVDVEGEVAVKVLDFGIAKVLADSPTVDDTSTSGQPAMFTPGYGAPEQFDRKLGATGPWTDVFALALIFVELVSGRRALDGGDFLELARQVLDSDVRPTARERGAATSDGLDAVLRRALSVEPRERYPEAGAFLAALEEVVEASDAPMSLLPSGAGASAAEGDASLATADFVDAVGLALSDASEGDEDDEGGEDDGDEDDGESNADDANDANDADDARAKPSPTEPDTLPSPEAPAATTRGGVSAPAPKGTQAAAAPPASRRGLYLVAAALVAAAIAFTAIRMIRLGAAPHDALPVGSTAPSASARPVSSNSKAAALYREALAAWRGGSVDDAVHTMNEATALDRELAAGQLRLVLWKFNVRPDEAREHYDIAARHRDKLSDGDRSLLDATEPLIRTPWDLAELDARLTALTSKRPDDVELWTYLAAARLMRRQLDAALEALEQVNRLDERAAGGWVLKGSTLGRKGDREGQLAAYEACLRHVPRAVECLRQRVTLRASLGDCAGMLADAKRLVSLEPKSAIPHRHLAAALHVTGAERAAVREALERSWPLWSEPERQRAELGDKTALAIFDGDFDRAVELLTKQREAAKGRTSQGAHAGPALDLAAVYRETGRLDAAAKVAGDFLSRMSAWTEPPSGDESLSALAHKLRAGEIDEQAFVRARATWRQSVTDKWKAAGRATGDELQWFMWARGHASLLDGEARAPAVVAAMPKEQTKAMTRGAYPAFDLRIGQALTLAGRHQAAIEPLRRATRSCAALRMPMTNLHAHYYLGRALEHGGDGAAARTAYQVVVDHWGQARPLSVTAKRAKARLVALP